MTNIRKSPLQCICGHSLSIHVVRGEKGKDKCKGNGGKCECTHYRPAG